MNARGDGAKARRWSGVAKSRVGVDRLPKRPCNDMRLAARNVVCDEPFLVMEIDDIVVCAIPLRGRSTLLETRSCAGFLEGVYAARGRMSEV